MLPLRWAASRRRFTAEVWRLRPSVKIDLVNMGPEQDQMNIGQTEEAGPPVIVALTLEERRRLRWRQGCCSEGWMRWPLMSGRTWRPLRQPGHAFEEARW